MNGKEEGIFNRIRSGGNMSFIVYRGRKQHL